MTWQHTRVQVHEEVLRLLLAAAPQLPVPQLAGYLQVGPASLLHCIAGSARPYLLSWQKPMVAGSCFVCRVHAAHRQQHSSL